MKQPRTVWPLQFAADFPRDFRNPGCHSEAVPMHSYRKQDLSPKRGYPFFAHAELTEENSGAHGTAVFVKIYAWPHFFQVRGTACRSDSEFGVAIEFGQIEAQYISVLNACLLEIEKR
jgi:hypothetical protein